MSTEKSQTYTLHFCDHFVRVRDGEELAPSSTDPLTTKLAGRISLIVVSLLVRDSHPIFCKLGFERVGVGHVEA
jgi:hypothetical protein